MQALLDQTVKSRTTRAALGALALVTVLSLAGCGGGGGGGDATASNPDSTATTPPPTSANGGSAPARPAPEDRPQPTDAARLLTQATFGIKSGGEIESVRTDGYERWLWTQFNTAAALHTRYLDAQKGREKNRKATEEMSYEAVWQQWLTGADQLRARTAFALGQILVISNIAPDIRPYAMSSYMDLLNRNAFGNYRTVLREVTLHPAMGYYLNMIESEKDDEARGIHPNENYAREVLQLFSIGLVQLNIDGTPKVGTDGKPLATYGEAQVKGFAKAFSGWTFASQNPSQPDSFHDANEELDSNWTTPMRAFASAHSPGPKTLLNGVTLPAGQTPEKDLDDAIDVIFNHPNVGPFIGRQLIQRLVTSNPSPAYVARVARTFNDNGSGVRGDLKAVVRAILLDPEARDVSLAAGDRYGKQREPVVRFASFLRALGAKSRNGINSIHYLDSADNGLGQSPLLAPSVFNFYSPNFRQPGAIARAGLFSPEFQITTETSVVGSLNFFADLFNSEGYGDGNSRLVLDLKPLAALAATPSALIDRLDALFFAQQMRQSTRARLTRLLESLPGTSEYELSQRVKAALIVVSLSPDFVIQK